jgi:hypothetical protein
MCVRIPLVYVDQKQMTKELTFAYKKNNIMKRKVQEEPKEVSCFACIVVKDKTYASVPLSWARTNFDIERSKGKVYDYKAIKTPWTQKQLDEIDSVITELRANKSVSLTLRTGAGKTAVSLFSACYFRLLTVILVHTDQLAGQWAKSVGSYTDASCEIIDLKTTHISKSTAIVICLYTRWRKIPLWVRRRVGLLVIDECDDFCNATGIQAIIGDSEDEGIQPEMVIGCTATFKRPGTGLEVIMNSVLGHNIVTRTFDVKFTVNKVCTGIKGHRQDAKYTRGVDWPLLKRSLLDSPERTALICSLALLRVEEGRKVMILCTENAHAESIFNTLDANGASADWFYGSKKKSYVDSDILVVGTKKGGRGFDEENACPDWGKKRIDCVMIVGFVNNETDLIQWIGRAFRAKDPVIDHFVDDDKTINAQWINMSETYKWMKATIQELHF